MTENCYISIKPYIPVIKLFAKCGECVGGLDGLFPIYEREFNLGQKVNSRCNSCVAEMLLNLNRLITEYESKNVSNL